MNIQATIPAGLAAVHNFILDHDETDLSHYLDDEEDIGIYSQGNDIWGSQGNGRISQAERTRTEVKRDLLAEEMWDSYQEFV